MMTNHIIGYAGADGDIGDIIPIVSENEAILSKAIEKAIAGGWKPNIDAQDFLDGEQFTEEGFIFNHDFAKALWGEYKPEEIPIGRPADGKYPDNLTHRGLRKWQYHLQQMVIADDPIKYLGENI